MTLWAPVVYGRTPASDTWWRAVPEGLNQHGWLATVVESVLGAGRELKGQPRFLLAQDRTHRIVGVACQASDLSDTMRSVGSRELYCFVGWVTSRIGQPWPVTPEFEELERGYRDWAAPVYGQVLADPWRAPATADPRSVATQPEPPVWPAPIRQPEPGEPPATGSWPKQAWPTVWAAAMAAREPLTCVIGWQHMTTARFEEATHIGVADAPYQPLPKVRFTELPAERLPVQPAPVKPAPAAAAPAGLAPAGLAPAGPGPTSTPMRPVPPRRAMPVPVSAAPDAGVAAAERWLAQTGRPPTERSGDPSQAGPPSGSPSPSGPSDVGRTQRGRVPEWARLAAAAAAGATVVGVLVGVLSSGPAPAVTATTAPAASPTSTATFAPASGQGAIATGQPVIVPIVVPASAGQTDENLVQYAGGRLSPGQTVVKMVRVPGSADEGACVNAVATAPVVTSVSAHGNPSFCVELNGTPPKYGRIDVTTFSNTAVDVTVTLWP